MIICLERGADCLHMVQLMPLNPKTPSSLASLKSRLVLPFWYRFTQAVLENRPLNGCSSKGSNQGAVVCHRTGHASQISVVYPPTGSRLRKGDEQPVYTPHRLMGTLHLYRAFPVAAAHTWNSLPEHIVSASTLQSFKRHLKTFLLQQSFHPAL